MDVLHACCLFTCKYTIMNTQKSCLLCASPLLGRTDKKFCNDHCRSHYYNMKNKCSESLILKINNRLRKNRLLLKSVMDPFQKREIPKDHLLSLGFNPDFFTHVQTSKHGHTIKICYDYGFRFLENQKVHIRKVHSDKILS